MLYSSRPVQLYSTSCFPTVLPTTRAEESKVTAIQKWMKPSPPVLFSLQAMSWEVALNPSDKVGRSPVVNLGLDGWKNSGLDWWLTNQCFRLHLCLSDCPWQCFLEVQLCELLISLVTQSSGKMLAFPDCAILACPFFNLLRTKENILVKQKGRK